MQYKIGSWVVIEMEGEKLRAEITKVYNNISGVAIDYDMKCFHYQDYKHEGACSFEIVKPSMIIC